MPPDKGTEEQGLQGTEAAYPRTTFIIALGSKTFGYLMLQAGERSHAFPHTRNCGVFT